ncbi:MAG: right-handed parallel beta-helix repeat-containing protein [Candidatus Cloacimonetes bacterium]|nr:right-handed parallel beta-helix repeat-containing protein [Candidatus Cloacimonadota bacterium]
MKKSIVLFLLIVGFTTTIFAVDHSGIISSNEWWDNVHSHFIIGNVSVADGVTLTIEAGTIIRFDENCSLTINGTLIADGTDSQNITFTSDYGGNTPGFWKYIYFNSADPGCILDYCNISYGGSENGMIYSNNSGSNVHITNCNIQLSGTKGLHLNDSATISNCIINNNTDYGIYCTNSYISDCTIQNNGNYAIRTGCGGVKNITGSMTISGNTHNSIYVISGSTNSGTWSDLGVDYTISGDLTINDGQTLTINAGSTLKFAGNYQLQVNGALIAAGTSGNPITFTSNQTTAGDWKYIYYNEADPGCILDYCDIYYGGSESAIIYSDDSGSNVQITNCNIQYSGTRGIYLTGYDSPTISNCTVSNSVSHGISCASSANPTISNCVINNNIGYGIYCSYSSISDCTIQNNSNYAIRIFSGSVKLITGDMTISGNSHNSIYVSVGGINTGTWNDHGVDYVIGGDLTIENGQTLTINAGNTLKFDADYKFQVNGTLIAEGTFENPITFTSNQTTPTAGDWKYLYFYNADTGCILDYCDIYYGGSSDGMIYSNNSGNNVQISNCDIRYSGTRGLSLNDSPSITNCVIDNNSTSGIYCTGSSANPSISNSEINNNYHGIYCNYSSANFSVSNCEINNNTGYGIYSTNSSISDCTIQNNGSYAIRASCGSVKNITGTMTISGNTHNSIYVDSGSTDSGTWYNYGVNYIIGGNLTVNNAQTLTIEAGNTLKFTGNYYLRNYGTLIADGTAVAHITFTSNQTTPTAGYWKNLYFHSAEPGCILDYCDIYYGGSETGMIYPYISGSNVQISNCDIQFSGTAGVYLSSSTPPVFSNCDIKNNIGKGIYCYHANPPISNCNINDNGSTGIYCEYASPSISNCEVNSNSGSGIYCSNSSANPVISNSQIDNNSGYGVYSTDFSISDCSVQNNGNYAIRTSGSSVKDITGNMIIAGNTINSIYVVSGFTDSGTWYNYGADYIMGGDLTIRDGQTLTIEAGNSLKFDGNYSLKVYGALIANGTSLNHITFTSNQVIPVAGNWKQIGFIVSDYNCSLSYCDILYGGSENGAIYSTESGSRVTISDCSILSSGTTGIYCRDNPTITNCVIDDSNGHGIYCNDDPAISNCVISNNSEHGIYCSGTTSDPTISDCTIQNNSSYAIRTPADNVKNITGAMIITGNTNNSIYVIGQSMNSGTWNYYGVPHIIGGDITINHGTTLTLPAGSTLKFDGNYWLFVSGILIANGTSENRITFTSNQENPASGDWRNVYFYYADNGCSLNNCDFYYGGSEDGMIKIDRGDDHIFFNNCNIEYSQNAGVWINTNSSPSFINCIIRNNDQYGIRVTANTGHPIFGSNLSEWNDIYDNNGDGLGRSFKNSTTNNTAEYIYWGTTDETEINNLIYDAADDSSLGVIDYTPWTNAAHEIEYPIANPDAPQNVTITVIGTQIQITWNAVTGATSYKVYSSADPYTGFAEDETGTFDGESWSASASNGKKFYYVKAVN